jgi:hypothetical protein
MKKYQSVNALFQILLGNDDVLSNVRNLLDVVVESLVIDDVAPHQICEFEVQPGRTNLAVVFLSAHDDAGNQIAFQIAPVTLTRFGVGPILVFGGATPSPIALNFIPGGPAWTADFVEPSPGKLAIEIADVGSPGVPVNWKGIVLVLGTQVK